MKIKCKNELHWGQKVNLPDVGEVKVSKKNGEVDVPAETAHLLVEKTSGWEYVNKKDWVSAEMIYREITELVPADVKAHLYLGNIYFSNNKFESSITEYRKVLGISGKKDINIMNNLGLAYMEANKNDLAAEQFREVLKIDPNNLTALNKLREMKKN